MATKTARPPISNVGDDQSATDGEEVGESPAPKPGKKKPTASSWLDDDAPVARAVKALKKPVAAKAAPAAKAKVKAKARANSGKVQNAIVDEDSAFGAMFASVAETDLGDGLVTSQQAEEMIIGIELPSLSLAYLFQQDVITLGRNVMLVGLPGACKSAMLAEMYRWVLLHRGMAGHLETENKDSPDLRNSLMWYEQALMKRLYYHPADSQEGWMEQLQAWMDAGEKMFAKVRKKKRAKKKMGENAAEFRARTGKKVLDDKPGYIYPMIYGVDSLTAVSGQATIDKIALAGSPERRFQIEAQILSDFAKTLPSRMRGRPIILASTNHLKPGQDENGYPIDNIPGGKAMRFMNSMEIKMTKVGKGIKAADYSGNKVNFTCMKNSLGETNLSIVADLKWWWEVDEATDRPIQRTVWDWNTATIDCLLAQKARSAKRWNRINEVVDIHVPAEGKRTFWSKELGIPSTSPVRFDEAGKALESRRDVIHELHKILHIKQRTKFTPGVDYSDVQEHLRRSAKRDAPIYSQADLSPVDFLDEELAAQASSRKAAASRKKTQDDDDDDDD